MERRLLLVFALTFLVIILFQPLLKKYMPQTATPAPETPAAQSRHSRLLSRRLLVRGAAGPASRQGCHQAGRG